MIYLKSGNFHNSLVNIPSNSLPLFPTRATNPAFKEVLSRIESHEDCRNLPMISFLILPMQRVTRLPLLMDVRTELFFYLSLMHVLLMLAFPHIQFLVYFSLFVSSHLHQVQGCGYWSVGFEVLCNLFACCDR